ncbi:ribonucleases P/MRP protein subunit POP1 isoform X2 [Periplaneta americana]|uniref:ribonucleases P/MRP protein subunit POP1 isoform X2 n=1 Tax=Periplaneta americana TaxID=6978 RepID=UPI0037E914AB
MATNTPQFDRLIGGTQDLPPDFSVKRFTSARAQEIAALTQAIEDPQGTCLVFQKLPKHMRRRVMSRTSKRLPRRLREAHMHQDISYYNCIELNGPVDYLLGQLKMLTSKECGLTFEAKLYLDGTREGSVMLFHPNAFPYGAIGKVNFLWKPILHLKSESDMQECQTRTLWIWVHPAFYQEVLDVLISLFHFTEVNSSEDSALNKVIFPSDVIDMLSDDPSISDMKALEKTSSPAKKKRKLAENREKKKDVEETKLAPRNVPFVRTPKYTSSNDSVKMTLLKDTLNRFRLTGPLSHSVLLESLNIAETIDVQSRKYKTSSKIQEESSDMDIICLGSSDECSATTEGKAEEDTDWWKSYYGESKENKESWHYQGELWKNLKRAASPAQLPPCSVLALTIQDPRLLLPSKKTKAVPDSQALMEQHSKENFTSFSPLASVSPIWSSQIRDSATSSKLSTAELAEIRSHNLVPGFISEEFDSEIDDEASLNYSHRRLKVKSCVPILLIQRPGIQNPSEKRLGYGTGWDVVMPAGWAMPLWLAFVFRGARAGGLRESESQGFEADNEAFLAADSVSGIADAEAKQMQLRERYFRLPPNKRPNYIKLGIASPFICSWNVLVSDWMQSTFQNQKMEHTNTSSNVQFFILRDRKKLEYLKSAIDDLKKKVRNGNQKVPDTSKLVDFLPHSTAHCLVPITVHMHGKGNPADHAIICLPSDTDVDNIALNASYPGPIENPLTDEQAGDRKELHAAHKRLLKSLRRKRVKERLKQEDIEALKEESECERDKESGCIMAAKRKQSEHPPTKDIVDKHTETMRSLWLPCTRKMKDSCSRTVIGFVTKGDFSFTESRGVGQGYVVLAALLQMLARCERRLSMEKKLFPPWVLIRNPTNLQYRFGVINIRSI